VQGRSPFQTYAIVESALFGKMLVLDGDTQSSALDEHIYHESLTHPACAAASQPERILILGGGEGATLREVLRVPSVKSATMVDIDGEVVELCRRHLPEWAAGAFADARTQLVIGDAKAYVEGGDEQFDVILGDLTEPLQDSPSRMLHSAAFYGRIRQRLRPGGVFALQTSMAGPHNCGLHAKMVVKLSTVFESVAPYSVYVPAFDTEWGFALCAQTLDVHSAAAAAKAQQHAAACGGLKYYDAESHRRLFNLPRYLRDAYAREKTLLG
jgi:spermidine synthase